MTRFVVRKTKRTRFVIVPQRTGQCGLDHIYPARPGHWVRPGTKCYCGERAWLSTPSSFHAGVLPFDSPKAVWPEPQKGKR